MRSEIPSVVGLLVLVGCGDAAAVANTLQKVCKKQCDCASNSVVSNWNEVKHCKQACEGYATIVQALIEDEAVEEPCRDLHKILDDIEGCVHDNCNPEGCLFEQYERLEECWPVVFTYYDYGYTSSASAVVSGAQLVHQLMVPVPGPIPADQLYAATKD